METPYLVCIDTAIEGRVSSVRDSKGKPVVFSSLHDAQIQIAENIINRLQEFISGKQEFDESVGVEEFAVPVDIGHDGIIADEDGNCYS